MVELMAAYLDVRLVAAMVAQKVEWTVSLMAEMMADQ
jgi:hypothetical protein